MLNRKALHQYVLLEKRNITIVKGNRKSKHSTSPSTKTKKGYYELKKTQPMNKLPNSINDTPYTNSLVEISRINDQQKLEAKIQDLKAFTARVKKIVRRRETMNDQKELLGTQNIAAAEESKPLALDDGSQVSAENSAPTRSSLINSYLSPTSNLNVLNDEALVPTFVQEKIQDDMLIYKCLTNPRNRQWNPLVEKIYTHETQLDDVSINVLRNSFIPSIRNLSFENIEKLDEMLVNAVKQHIKSAKVAIPMAFYESIFKNLSDSANSLSDGESFKYVISYFDKLIERYEANISAKTSSKSFRFNTLIMNHIISYVYKMSEHSSYSLMNKYLEKFQKDFQVTPNRNNYTTLISYSINEGNIKQAWDLFDTMKFLSVKDHAPDEYAYISMIMLCNKELNYAKALDIYQEVIDLYEQSKNKKKHSTKLPIHLKGHSNFQPSLGLLSIMAMVMARCSKDSYLAEGKQQSLLLKGWQFIHEIYDRTNGNLYDSSVQMKQLLVNRGRKTANDTDHSPYHVLKSMLALAAHDGDVSMARALYFKFVSSIAKSTAGGDTSLDFDPSFFNYLLYAYSRFDATKVPILATYDEGIDLRAKIINSCDYTYSEGMHDDASSGTSLVLPYLPKVNLHTEQEILLESRAVWQWHIEKFYTAGNHKVNNTSKSIIENYENDIQQCKDISNGNYKLFEQNVAVMIDHWRKEKSVDFKLLNEMNLVSFLHIALKMNDLKEFQLRLEKFSISEAEIKELIKTEFEFQDDSEKDMKVARNRYELYSLRHRLLRGNELYLLCMKAACHFKDLEFGKKIWTERGEYRKTANFKKSLEDVKNKGGQHDELFAREICSLFTQLGHYTDAMSIILGSEKYINWKYKDVKMLYHELLELEDFGTLSTLQNVLRKSEKKYDSNLKKIDEQLSHLEI